METECILNVFHSLGKTYNSPVHTVGTRQKCKSLQHDKNLHKYTGACFSVSSWSASMFKNFDQFSVQICLWFLVVIFQVIWFGYDLLYLHIF